MTVAAGSTLGLAVLAFVPVREAPPAAPTTRYSVATPDS